MFAAYAKDDAFANFSGNRVTECIVHKSFDKYLVGFFGEKLLFKVTAK